MDFLLAVIIMMSDDLHKAGYTIDKAELTCVAKNVYFESRGENITNKMYVASVTRNRLEDKRWPNTYCGVVNQRYQFSWTEENHDIGATIMFGTNTFLSAYAKKAHAYDFYTLRYIVAGAEKLHDSTRDLWAEKFGLRVLEGYGATETAPVASVNTPMDFKAGTVGRLMPNMQYKLEQIPGIEDAGQLHVYGPNIMQGYLLSDNPGKLIPPKSVYGKGWYDTGDIVNIDEDGFVSIRGRTKRFAKVSGEMVSLAAIEAHAVKAWPNAQHASTSMPDSKKGEQVILLTTQKGADSKQLAKSAKGVHAISLPKRIFVVKDIPVLATGKTNYPEVSKLADKKLQDSSKIQSDQIAAQED